MDVVWLRHGLQGMALVAWLPTALFATALAEIVRAGLLQAVAAWGLAAVAAVFPQAVLKGVKPCLQVDKEGRQLTDQGLYGFFTPQVGGMNIFWGRQVSWCHVAYCARFFSVLHQGMINFLVCLSSNLESSMALRGCP
jgi:rhamnogalacturonyl hydrolase YesR